MKAVWPIPTIAPVAKERLGYAARKPLALLGRIINASSDEGDAVLDLFCGPQPKLPMLDRKAGFKKAARDDSGGKQGGFL
jgi:DNA methylase